MKENKLKLVAKILAIIIICLISFVGIYAQNLNKMENVVKDFSLGRELTGYRQVVLKVSEATKVLDSEGNLIGNTDNYSDDTIESSSYKKTDEKVNSNESLTVENYEICKRIIEDRLKDFDVNDYNISLDKQSGTIYIQIPENDTTDHVVNNIKEIGSFEIADSEDGTVYITEEHLKKVQVLYSTTESGTIAYLDLQLNKEGTSILKDLSSNEYAKKEEITEQNTEETTEETTTEQNSEQATEETETENEENSEEATEENKQKEVALSISGTEMLTTSFEEPIEDGIIDLSMNSATTDTEELADYVQSASTMSVLLNNGEMPLTYTYQQNKYVSTDISNDLINKVIIVLSTIFVIALIYMIIKNKLRGFLAAISTVGFLATYLLLLRYTNVLISLVSIIGIVLIMLINYIINLKLLTIQKENQKEYNKAYSKIIATIMPAFAVSIIFCFIKLTVLANFGMTMFWGIVLMLVYNRFITKKIVD